ncbi:hypothetical protein LCGC14_2906860 [marine sediment metagenome]|uniref:Uncharacterized protein n=1 Tax=marine sediment metagenome TaxID=412755 RepID=A0A0F8YEJ7_9ZZZZ
MDFTYRCPKCRSDKIVAVDEDNYKCDCGHNFTFAQMLKEKDE